MDRAFELMQTHRDKVVKRNVEAFLKSIQCWDYSIDKYKLN